MPTPPASPPTDAHRHLHERISARRAVLLGLAAGLSLAAAVAIVALLTHSFDATDARLIGTSLGFSVLSALGAAGAPARRRRGLAPLGAVTMGVAGLAFGLLELAIWVIQTTGMWRAFGAVAVLALAVSHASLVLSARRAGDSPTIVRLCAVSVLAGAVDAVVSAVAITGLVHHVSSGEVRLAAALVIVLLLSTALPPILRRAARPPAIPTGRSELVQIARRLEALAPAAGSLSSDLRVQAARLHSLAER